MKSQITLCGQCYTVSVERIGGKTTRFIGNEEVGAFIERMSLLGRLDVLEDLAHIGEGVVGNRALVLDSPQETAFALHQNRTRRN